MAHRVPILVSITLLALAAFTACGKRPATLEDLNSRMVTLPDGFKVRAEVMVHQTDMRRGMMFRDSLEEGRGMLFVHGSPGEYPYWMYQVRIPLDIIWLDKNGWIKEIVADAPPCETNAQNCPNHGGNEIALYVLELPAGSVARHNLRVGARIRLQG